MRVEPAVVVMFMAVVVMMVDVVGPSGMGVLLLACWVHLARHCAV